MDPTVTFAEIIDMLNIPSDIDGLVEKCEALHKWIRNGGSPPTQKVGYGLTREGYLVFLTAVIGYWGDPDRSDNEK